MVRSLGVDFVGYPRSFNALNQLCLTLELGGIKIVYDIGANKGQFAKIIRQAGYKGKIISFEPLSSARNKLIDSSKNDPKWIIHEQCAIGDFDGAIDINISGNSVSSSVLPMNESHSSAVKESSYIGKENVPVLRLDSITNKYLNPDSKLFIKIDTQGYEWQVLDGAPETLRLSSGIMCELSLIHLYAGQKLWREIIDRLENQGFILWAIEKGFTDLRTGQTLQKDGTFIKKSIIQIKV